MPNNKHEPKKHCSSSLAKLSYLLYQDLLGEVKKIAQFLGKSLSNEVAEKVAHFSTMDEMRKTYDKHEEDNPEGIKHTRALGQLKFLNKGIILFCLSIHIM